MILKNFDRRVRFLQELLFLLAVSQVSPSAVIDIDPTVYCTGEGRIPNPLDKTNRTFIECKLKHESYECSEGFHFSEEKVQCIENPDPIDHSIIDWHKVLQCPPDAVDHYYRNPYDCGRFYRCYRHGDIVRLDVNSCPTGMYFEEEYRTCISIKDFIKLNGKCHQKPLPSDKSYVDWTKVLTCPPYVEDKFFRNPYDCTRFYRCYKQGETIYRMDPMQCISTMYFDENISTCLPIVAYNELNGDCYERALPLENEDIEKEKEYWEEQERLRKEKERKELEEFERERLERELLEKLREEEQKAENERLERERQELERLEEERRQEERDELEKLEKIEDEAERLQLEKDKLIQDELERERKAAEEMERLHKEKERLEKEKHQLELELHHKI